jgi:hypothetical protein
MELLGGLSSSIPNLVRDELELLRAQLGFVLARLQAASLLLVVAISLVMATVMLLVAAAVSGLTMYIIHLGLEPAAAVAVATLVIAVTAGIVAAALVIGANGEFRRAEAAIEQSMDAVARGRSRESEI